MTDNVNAGMSWWRRFYVLTLVLTIGATSTIGPLVSVAEYGRYVAASLLLAVTWATSRNIQPTIRSKLQRRMLIALWWIVIAAAASIMWSSVPGETALNVVALFVLVAIVHLLSTRRWTTRATMVRDLSIGYMVLVASFVASLIALVIGYVDAEGFNGRFQGIYNNPNMMAQVAVISIPLGWGIFKERPTLWRLAWLVPSTAVVFLSESRTAIVALAITTIWLVLRSSTTAILGTAYVAVALGGVAVATQWTPLSSSLDRFGTRLGGPLNGRLEAWTSAINLTLDQPIGYGWAAGEAVFESMFGYASFTFSRTSVHNSYLQYFLELGVIGLIPLLYILTGLAIILVRGETFGVGAGLIGTILAGSVLQIAESAMFGTGQSYPYIFWFAVAGALTLYEPRESKQEIARLSRYYNRPLVPKQTKSIPQTKQLCRQYEAARPPDQYR